MENTTKLSAVLKKVPFDIILFHLFAVAITAFSFYLDLDRNKELRTALIPYTGWGFGNRYMFPVFFIPIGLFSFNTKWSTTLLIVRGFIILEMLMECYNGFEDWRSVTPEDYTNPNPYLRYDTLTPIYTMAMPLFWIVVVAVALLWSLVQRKKQQQPFG